MRSRVKLLAGRSKWGHPKSMLAPSALFVLCACTGLFGQDDDTKPLSNGKLYWNVPAGHNQGALYHDYQYEVYGAGGRRIISQWGIVLAARDFRSCPTCDVLPYKAAQTLYKSESLNTSIYNVNVGSDPIRKYWRTRLPELWVLDVNSGEKDWNASVWSRNDFVEPDLVSDQMVTSTVNSSIGLTITQRAYAWTNPDYDDFIIVEYVCQNTGNYNADELVENPDNVLSGVYIGLQSMSQISGLGGLVVSRNAGINHGNDDWVDYYGDEPGDSLKVIYAWDGDASPEFAAGNDEGDIFPSTGMMLSPQYVGRALIYAPVSVVDPANDPAQPVVTHMGHWGTGGDLISGVGNPQSDKEVYNQLSTINHITQPFDENDWLNGVRQSYTDKYATDHFLKTATLVVGPYDFPQVGDSIRIITALAVGSISFERSIDLLSDSDNYLADLRSGRDSLFAVVSRAKNAFYHPSTGWDFSLLKGSAIDLNITDPLPAPSVRYISDSSHVRISWEDLSQVIDYNSGIADWAGYRVYRRVQPLFDLGDPMVTIYDLIYESAPLDTVTFYDDYDVVLGQNYWYSVTVLDADGLESHPALNQSVPGGTGRETEQSAGPFLPALSHWGGVVVVPNPYHTYAARFGGALNTISFFNLPYSCRLRIYSQTGDLVKTILKEPGISNVQEWNQISDADQYIVSGLYIYVVDQAQDDYRRPFDGKYIGKFVIIR